MYNNKINYRLLAILNCIAFAFVVLMNIVAVKLPLNNKTTGELADQYPNLFTPAGFTFSIWSVIYTFLLGFIIYQAIVLFKNKGATEKIVAISPYFILNCMANGAWLFAWHYEIVGLSVMIMFIMLSTLIVIHHKLDLALPWRPLQQKLWLDLPFSLYLGWISIATIANVTTLFVDNNIQPLGISSPMWTMIMIGVGALLALVMILKSKNYAYALVVCWAFYGIIAKRNEAGNAGSEDIVAVAIACIAILLVAIIIKAVSSSLKRS
ncbi:hypothetical protein [Aridibaculum aurantiacum]|uniref:hypothetical protein n=1 Tax=Aridibaculum aurantiacum TaxID=2810307 RepID=UPI001A973749|nr:hypothetical protein [Aridibaculum aurantiacum]